MRAVLLITYYEENCPIQMFLISKHKVKSVTVHSLHLIIMQSDEIKISYLAKNGSDDEIVLTVSLSGLLLHHLSTYIR